MTKLSIIVTSYNIERYIGECLDSVVGQTLDDIEIIVVDDGSSDGTQAIISEYAARDPRIKTIFFENNTIGGVGSAANAGLDAATGDYVGFADGDDICELTMFARLYEAAAARDADLAMCKYLLLEDQTNAQSEPAENQRWQGIDADTFTRLNDENRAQYLRFIAVPWRKIYRRSLMEENAIRFPVGDYFFEDNPFHWFSLICAESLVLVPEVLCYHRIARAGQTMETADERLFKIFIHHDTIRDWLVSTGHEAAYRQELLGWAVTQLEWISRRTPQPLMRKLFDISAKLVANYSAEDVEKMLKASGKGQRARKLVTALRLHSFHDFKAELSDGAAKQSLVRAGFYHLRHSGVRQTAAITYRFLQNATGFSKNGNGLSGPDEAVSNADLMFAMVVLQRKLEAIEARLDQAKPQTPSEPKP